MVTVTNKTRERWGNNRLGDCDQQNKRGGEATDLVTVTKKTREKWGSNRHGDCDQQNKREVGKQQTWLL